MEYKLCEDNTICCDSDCRRCANLVHDALTNENKNLKKEFDKWDKERDGFFNEIKRLAEERDRIHDELKELKSKKMVPLSDVYQIIAGHNDYHGGNILSALTCIAEGKDVGPVATYEPVNDALTDENKRLKAELKKFEDKCVKLEKENDYLEKENIKLRDDNQRFAKECRYYIERESNLVKENNDLRVINDQLRTMNSELLYRNGLLMKTTGPNIFQKVYIYDELNDKIESLKEDIIRLDKCLSNRQCVQLERIKEEDHA